MNYDFDLIVMFDTMRYALAYLPTTLVVSLAPIVIALIISSYLAFGEYLGKKRCFYIGRFFSMYSRTVPVVLTLLICNFGIYGLIQKISLKYELQIDVKVINAIWIGIFALAVNGIGYLVETMRSALNSVGKGQLEAGYSIGMTTLQIVFRILFPQIMVEALPNLQNNITATVKLSAITFTIAIVEVFNASFIYTSSSYRYIEAYVGCAIIYWILNEVISKGLYGMEILLRRKQG